MDLPSCPKCGSKMKIESVDGLTYTSNPPCYRYKCNNCGEYFYSTINCYTPSEGFDNYFSNNDRGWECPKCGRVFAPHIDECPYCGGDYNNQVTCNNQTIIPT